MQIPILLGVEGESAELVKSFSAGLCFEPENKTDFLEKLKLLKENKDLYLKCQEGCLSLAKSFDRKKMASDMRKQLNQLVRS